MSRRSHIMATSICSTTIKYSSSSRKLESSLVSALVKMAIVTVDSVICVSLLFICYVNYALLTKIKGCKIKCA